MKVAHAKFVVSNTKVDQCPKSKIPEYAFIGRSNVGKSTLFNRLLGRKEAITGEEYGLTRDYQAGRCILNDVEFNLIDTAGYNINKSELSRKINDTINNISQ